MPTQARPEGRADLHERWQRYLAQARRRHGAEAPFETIVKGAGALWREHEPVELAFAADRVLELLAAERHEPTVVRFLERAERGEIAGFRHDQTGDVIYVAAEHLDRVPADGHFHAYDPLLARVLHAAMLEEEIDRIAEAGARRA